SWWLKRGLAREELRPAMKSCKIESQETTCSSSTGLTSELARPARPEARSPPRSGTKAHKGQQRLDTFLGSVSDFPVDFEKWISRHRNRMDTTRDSEDLNLWQSRACDLMGRRGPRKARALQVSL
ncbi:unnamed protein product, partial [Effrenium voratum]